MKIAIYVLYENIPLHELDNLTDELLHTLKNAGTSPRDTIFSLGCNGDLYQWEYPANHELAKRVLYQCLLKFPSAEQPRIKNDDFNVVELTAVTKIDVHMPVLDSVALDICVKALKKLYIFPHDKSLLSQCLEAERKYRIEQLSSLPHRPYMQEYLRQQEIAQFATPANYYTFRFLPWCKARVLDNTVVWQLAAKIKEISVEYYFRATNLIDQFKINLKLIEEFGRQIAEEKRHFHFQLENYAQVIPAVSTLAEQYPYVTFYFWASDYVFHQGTVDLQAAAGTPCQLSDVVFYIADLSTFKGSDAETYEQYWILMHSLASASFYYGPHGPAPYVTDESQYIEISDSPKISDVVGNDIYNSKIKVHR